jgi:uncharacterized membrane protein
MRHTLQVLILLFSISFGFAQGFSVEQYSVEIDINSEGYFDVVERYDINFSQYKHGIYRDIQTNYTVQNVDGETEKRRIQISNIEVPGHIFEASNRFEQKIEGKVRIKIGDPNRTIVGPQHYEIRYRISNAFLFEENATVFYWNLKPTDWLASFKAIDFTIRMPEGVSVQNSDCFLYSGAYGTSSVSDDFNLEFSNGVFSGVSKPNVISAYGQSVTALVNLPPGSVKENKPFWPFWTYYGWIFLLGGLIIGFYFIWRKYGKDKRVTTTTSYYPPEDIDPAMAGYLIDDSGESTDLISLIPYWGAKGYLKMEEIDKKGWLAKDDTRITKLKDLPSGAPDYQRKLFNGLFGSGTRDEVLVSSLKDKFYTIMNSAKIQLKKSAQRYYEPESKKVQTWTGCSLVMIMVLFTPVLLFFWGWIAAAALIVLGIVLLILNIYMIKKNRRGDRVFSELKGFKQFIKTAEENKLKMLISESPVYFESTMGYAVAFGAFKGWAKKFEGLNVKPPEWYSTSSPGHYNFHSFSNSFSSSISSTRSTMISSPSSSGSSSGGGSSGGGFGGGGGGSW